MQHPPSVTGFCRAQTVLGCSAGNGPSAETRSFQTLRASSGCCPLLSYTD